MSRLALQLDAVGRIPNVRKTNRGARNFVQLLQAVLLLTLDYQLLQKDQFFESYWNKIVPIVQEQQIIVFRA